MAFTFFLPDGYSKADLVNLNRVHTKLGKIRRWLIPALRVVFTLGGIFLIWCAALLLAFDGIADGMLASIIVFFLVGVLWLLLGLPAADLEGTGQHHGDTGWRWSRGNLRQRPYALRL